MNSDSYEFRKSSAPQGVDLYTPYQEKQWGNIPDINSGVYSNNGASQVQFDLTSIYNSGGGSFCDTADLFLTIPIVMVAQFTGGAATQVPVVGNSNLLSLKSNFQHLIHQIEVVSGGKVVNESQPFQSMYQNFKLLSSMSVGDLKQWGSSLGLGEEVDSEKSVQYFASTTITGGAQCGVGLTNNRPYVSDTVAGTSTGSTSALGQNSGAVNTSIQRRLSRIVDTTPATANASFNRVYGSYTAGAQQSIMNANQLALEFKPYYTVNAANQMIWQDLAVIPLKYICDVLDKMGLVKRLDLILRCYLNTGSLTVPVANPNTNTLQYGLPTNNTFSYTCPFTVNWLGVTSAAGGIPAACTAITAGCFVRTAPTTSITAGGVAVNLASSAASHAMPSCRVYYSLVKLEPSRALSYIEANRSKEVVYENFIFNQYNNVPSGSFSQLIQSGIKNPIGIAIIPLISGLTATGLAVAPLTLGFEQFSSPYDTCPSTYSPISLTNLQVSLGGVNQLNGGTLFYTFENFMEQVGLAETLTSSDLGLGCGLVSQAWWEMNRVYYVDLSRGRDSDKAAMRNLTLSFTNNSNCIITLMVFTIFLDKLVLDVETGIVRK